jgi:hypothetical protein
MYDTVFMIFFVILMFASVAGLIILSFLLFRGNSSSSQAQQNDVTNMMILFQTMRDLLSEQKELARQFNHSIDHKVSEVRALLESRDEVQRLLLEAKRDIAQLTEDTRRELAGIRRQAGGSNVVDEEAQSAAPLSSEESKHSAEPAPKKEHGGNGTHPPLVEGNGSAPLRAIPEPAPVHKRDFIDAWTGVDFGTSPAPDEDEPAHVADEVDAVDDAATREAYRSLLNVHSGDDESPAPDPFHPESNEIRNELTPIQMRVYEYADAGMRVPEIARELGVGKGEVRLILSLRKGQRR